ncbi:MAG: DUF5989 family protein [Myxococcota bacterium]
MMTPHRPGLGRRVARRARTAAGLVAFFARRHGFFFVPLVAVLVLAGALLALTGGLSYVAPFVYTLF